MNLLTTVAALVVMCTVVHGRIIPRQGLQSAIYLVNKKGREPNTPAAVQRGLSSLSRNVADRSRRHIFGPCKTLLTRRSQGVSFKIMHKIAASKLRRICGKRIFRFTQRLDLLRCNPKFLSCSK